MSHLDADSGHGNFHTKRTQPAVTSLCCSDGHVGSQRIFKCTFNGVIMICLLYVTLCRMVKITSWFIICVRRISICVLLHC